MQLRYLLAALVLSAPLYAHAQAVTGAIRGVIEDPSAARVANASIDLKTIAQLALLGPDIAGRKGIAHRIMMAVPTPLPMSSAGTRRILAPQVGLEPTTLYPSGVARKCDSYA